MSKILDIFENVKFDNAITEYEWHSHDPYSKNFKNSDEIRIPIHQQDIFTHPHKSFLLVTGKIIKPDDKKDDTTTDLINNCIAFLFDEIRYEICGTEVDRIRNPGITSTMKNILTARPEDSSWMGNAGWNLKTVDVLPLKTNFSFCIPLKLLLGFIEDYDKILLNVKQELVLLRSSSDKNAIHQTISTDCEILIDKLTWKMPYVKVEDSVKLSLLKVINSDQPIRVPFRRWQLHEFPSLPSSQLQTWTVKTSSMTEKPRFVVVGLQSDRKDKSVKNSSQFDLCDLENVKLYLNSKYYPYDNLNGDTSLLYHLYSSVQSSYYLGSDDQPCLDRSTFLSKTPIFVVDCSKQLDTLKTGSLDVRLEIQTKKDIPANTSAYCLIIHDSIIQYTPISGIVQKIM